MLRRDIKKKLPTVAPAGRAGSASATPGWGQPRPCHVIRKKCSFCQQARAPRCPLCRSSQPFPSRRPHAVSAERQSGCQEKLVYGTVLFLFLLHGTANGQPPRGPASLCASQSKAAPGTHAPQDASECALAPWAKGGGQAVKADTPEAELAHHQGLALTLLRAPPTVAVLPRRSMAPSACPWQALLPGPPTTSLPGTPLSFMRKSQTRKSDGVW